jgi:predicted MFS family arabinose efflux permease
MVADVVPEAGRLRAYSWIRIARNAGWAAGPMAGSFAGSGGLPALALATGLLGLVNFAQCAVLLPESPHLRPIEKFRPTDLGISLSDPVFRAHALASFALFMGFAQLLVTVSLDVPKRLEIPAEQLKWIYSLNGAMVVFFQALVTRAVQRFRRSHVLAAGALSYGAGYLCIGLSHDLSGVLLGAATVTLGELLALPTCVALTAELAPEDQRGRYLGAYGVCLDVGHGAGQIAGGAGLAAAGAHPLRFWCPVAVFCALSGAAFLRVGTLLRARKAVLRAASSTSSA